MLHLTPDCWVGLSYWRNLKYPRVWWGWRPVPLGVKVTGTARGPAQLEGNTQGECVGNWGHRGTGWGTRFGSSGHGDGGCQRPKYTGWGDRTSQQEKAWHQGRQGMGTWGGRRGHLRLWHPHTKQDSIWYFLLLRTFSPFVFIVEPRYACYWSSLLLIHFNLNDTSVE